MLVVGLETRACELREEEERGGEAQAVWSEVSFYINEKLLDTHL